MEQKRGQRLDMVLVIIAVLSAFLNTFFIWKNTYANAYYTAAVTSMLKSFHNFSFASFDPAGFITVDKPPVALWIQTIFAYVFGVHGWSVILPQALAGIGSVLLVYYLVKPTFGKTAARLTSLVMACTPVAVAVSRTNNIDSLLVFTLLLATWMLFRAVRKQTLPWVLGAFAMVGIGFNMKMLQAYMVVPAFYSFYLLAFKTEWRKKLAVLAAATVVLVGVSLSWAVVVDTTSPDNRPYIGGSKTNSVLELAFGYNGISRLTGMNRGGMGTDAGRARHMPPDNQNVPNRPQMPPTNNAPNWQQMPPDGNNTPQGFNPKDNGKPVQRPGFDRGGRQGRGGGMFGTGQPGSSPVSK